MVADDYDQIVYQFHRKFFADDEPWTLVALHYEFLLSKCSCGTLYFVVAAAAAAAWHHPFTDLISHILFCSNSQQDLEL